MSKKTDEFEQAIANLINQYDYLPEILPSWMEKEGIIAGSKIIKAEQMGNSGEKTDVIVYLEGDSQPIKISAKLSSADYFGNWYGHIRLINEFGEKAFYKLVQSTTLWANKWKYSNTASIFVGVSINFGRRTGKTGEEFTDVFDYEDIVKVVAGYGEGDSIANCLMISDKIPDTLEELLVSLRPIDEDVIMLLSENFKVVYRPINPGTEGTNRGKNVYTKFQPYAALKEPTVINTLEELNKLGEYVELTEPNRLNHNHILDELENEYNIYIPRKS
ncbi:MAG TPA: hypothetical protein DEA45_01375 [Acholeplasmataceae bacterium]|nr:hypothetical protein [Acholeplasmataceae bacterium]